MKVGILTFIFPIAEPYYKETLNSIYMQIDQDFDLIVVDDKLNANNLPVHVRHIYNNDDLSIIKLREHIFNLLIEEGYDLLISIDSDDTMEIDRVGKVKDAYLQNLDAGFYYTPFYYMSDPNKPFFSIPDKVNNLSNLLYSNFIGLSHVSFNLKKMRENDLWFNFPENIVALDWYIVSYLLYCEFEGYKTGSKCYYRLYDLNTAGETSLVSIEKFKAHVKVKIKHYIAVLNFVKVDSLRVILLEELTRLNEVAVQRDEEINKYIKNMAVDKTNYWWAGI